MTRLDRVGVPVYVSVRPEGRALCVNAGKGIRPIEAEAGAWMEAIEFALAEFGAAPVPVVMATPGDLLDGRPTAVLDFCPTVGAEIDLDAPLACVRATDPVTGEEMLVPAQLVFLPFPTELGGARYFTATSNGLASGNGLLEATVHGLAELIERDITSFQVFDDPSALVEPSSYPPVLAAVTAAVADAGLALHLRAVPNEFALPCFTAAVVDPEIPDPIHVYGGSACHPLREVAAVRAACEALQSRLSLIHGGRDDLADRYGKFEGWPGEARAAYGTKLLDRVASSRRTIAFGEVEGDAGELESIEAAFAVLLTALERAGLSRVLRVAYTRPEDDLQVVRVIVPGLEYFSDSVRRIGPRLTRHADATA